MTTIPAQPESNVQFQLRPDLEYSDYALGVSSQLVVKDPLKLQYFLFESFEKVLLDLLKRPSTIFELKSNADQRLAPGHIELSEIKKFITRLSGDNLIVSSQTGAGRSLLRIDQRVKRLEAWQRLLGVLAIRFRGVNPQYLLDGLNPLTRFFFHPMFLVLAVVSFAAAIVTVLLNINRIFETDFLAQNLTSPRNVAAVFIALGVVKILHELGHALACRSIGRDCHELGVMLLAFVPCLYCNVSDTWMEPNRWKRMLVSAAGIYVEMLIAVLCVPLWLLSHDGPVQTFWFAMLMICSVNTLLINGNPLLRYDGYYILSDWLKIPNLSTVAQKKLNDRIRYLFVRGVDNPSPIGFLEFFALASKIYRVLIIGVIIYAIFSFLERIELPSLGILSGSLLLAMTFSSSWYRAFRIGLSKRFYSTLKLGRSFALLLLLIAMGAVVAMIPVTTKTFADGQTALAGKGLVYAPHDGQVNWFEKPGAFVQAGEELAEISNLKLKLELIQQQQLVTELKLAIKNQQILQRQGAENLREIELRKESLANAERVEAQLQTRIDRLTIRAANSGRLVSLPDVLAENVSALDLGRATSALLLSNEGCWVKRGEPIAAVVDSEALTVRLRVPERQVQRVAKGQSVDLLISQSSPEIVAGTVEHIAIEQSEMLLSEPPGQDLESKYGFVEVVVSFDEMNNATHVNSNVRAAIIGDRIPFYLYCWQAVRDNLDL